MHQRFGLMLLASVVALPACGSSEDPPTGTFPAGTTCGLKLALSGAVMQTIGPESAIACATQLSSSSGIDVGFLSIDAGDLQAVDLVVDAVEKTKTETALPGSLRIRLKSGKSWTAPVCSVDVTSQALDHSDSFADHYRTQGKGSCGAGTGTTGDPTVTIGDFDFVATIPWAL